MPLVGCYYVVISLIKVDFPATLGPRKPKICPSSTSRSIPSTAFMPSYDLKCDLAKTDFIFLEMLDSLNVNKR